MEEKRVETRKPRAKATTRAKRTVKKPKTDTPKKEPLMESAVIAKPPEPEKKKSEFKAPSGLMQKFALIKMHPKRDATESDDVPVCVNGHNILLQRGKWCPVNWSFVEDLRHACHPKFSQEPGQQRIEIGTTERYPFQGPYEITSEQYVAFREMLKANGVITDGDITRMASISV